MVLSGWREGMLDRLSLSRPRRFVLAKALSMSSSMGQGLPLNIVIGVLGPTATGNLQSSDHLITNANISTVGTEITQAPIAKAPCRSPFSFVHKIDNKRLEQTFSVINQNIAVLFGLSMI